MVVCKHIINILFKHYIYIYIILIFSDHVKYVKIKRIDKNKIYMYSDEHNNVFTALVATSFSRYDHHQANAIQNLKKLATCSA